MDSPPPFDRAVAEPLDLPPALRSHELLTAPEEVALAKAVERGDPDARRRLIVSNVRLVVSLSRRYRGLGVAPADLVQEGILGLTHAVDRYDWRLGYRFSTYATWWIRQAMQRAVARDGRLIRLPMHVAERRRFLDRMRSELRARLAREPTVEELARAAEVAPARVEATFAVPETTSLDAILASEERGQPIDVLRDGNAVDPAAAVERELERQAVRSAVAALPPRERTTITLRFGLDGAPETLDDIAESLGITRERARQIEERALARLARRLGGPPRDVSRRRDPQPRRKPQRTPGRRRPARAAR